MFGMSNPFMTNRLASILRPQSSTGPTFRQSAYVNPNTTDDQSQSTVGNSFDASRYYDQMQKLQEEGPALAAYKQGLGTLPQQDQFKQNWWQRLATAAAGGGYAYSSGDAPGAINMVQDIQQTPYQQAMVNYGQKMKNLGEAADIEQSQTDSRLKEVAQARALGLKYDEYELKRRETEAKLNNESKNTQIAQQRADAYVQSLGRPELESIPQADGSIMLVDKRSGRREVVPGNTVSAALAKIQGFNAQTGRINAATNQGNLKVNQRNSDLRAQDVQSLEDYRKNGRPRQDVPLSPSQQANSRNLALDELSNDPDFADFITTNPRGFHEIDPSIDPQDYQDLMTVLQDRIAKINRGGR